MSTIKVNTLDTTSGTTITVATGKTLTVEGVSVTSGSTNIQRATGDVTIGTTSGYEVAGKSEVVVAANAASATRTITLPAVGATGMSTCIITVVADADATSTYKLVVQDADSAEVWTGYQKNDFVRLIVSNSAWVVVDHKETYYSRRWLTANQSISASSITKLTGWTNVTEIGNMWDNANNKVVMPSDMSGWMDVTFNNATNEAYSGVGPALYLDGAVLAKWWWPGTNVTDGHQSKSNIGGRFPVTTAQYLEFYAWNLDSNSTYDVYGGAVNRAQWDVTFTRTY